MARAVGGRLILPVSATPPATPTLGEVYIDSALGVARWWNGTKWVPLGGLA